MFNTEDFKKSALDRAMRGKLTKQLPEDGDAKNLLNQIDAEKKSLINDGKIKAQKSLPEITEDEIPFEIPDNWQWVRLGDVGTWKSGSTPKRNHSEYYNGTIPWLKTGDLNNGYIVDTTEKITQKGLDSSNLKLNSVGSVLIAMYGATIGKLGILNIASATNQACCACNPYSEINNKFLFYYLMSQKNKLISLGAGGAQPNISRNKIINYTIPIPPLSEQKRIVENIDKCFDLANYIDQEVSLTDKFNFDMRKSLLQSAMMGKLTKQLPEDGDASELLDQIKTEKEALVKAKKIKKQKPLPEIDADEIPFEIPDNWRWVRLGDIYSILQVPTVSKNQYKENGIPFYRIKDIVSLSKGIKPAIDIFISKEDYFKNIKNKGTVKSGDILITATGTLGTSCIIENDEPMYFQGSNNIIWLKNIIHFNSKFINIILQSNEFSIQIKKMAKGSTLKHLSISLLSNLPIPLPPLPEQKRIVKKLDKLLDELKG